MRNGRHAFADKDSAGGMKRVYREGFRYSKAEVLLLDLSPSNEITGDLFAGSASDE
ncbi:hypothetical protein PPTS312_44130 [Pseudomonas putida]|uniref:Uncharacterized protein n=1 Tax=Pseudomonas putida TaxID=303 RepID=A0A7U6M657_PSEPU|nr:hypothetical protein PPTS312_44130 [Pseudomonas putida]